MHTTIDTRDTVQALRVLAPALSRANPVAGPACGWIAADETLTLRAASLEWDVQYAVQARTGLAGEAWIPAPLARAIPWGQLGPTVTVRATPKAMDLRAGNVTYTLPLVPRKTVLAIDPATTPCAEADGPALARALLLGASAPQSLATPGADESADTSRRPRAEPDRDGAWIEIEPSAIRVSSTDRVRIASATIAASGHLSITIAIPTHAALALSRAAALAETVQLFRSATRRESPVLTARAGRATITVRTLAALPPDPRQITWGHVTHTLSCHADQLTRALRATLAIAGTDPRAVVTLRPRKGHLSIETACHDSTACATLDGIDADWPETTVTMPARELLAGTAPLGDATLTLAIAAPLGPVQLNARTGVVAYRAMIAQQAAGQDRIPAAASAAGGATA